MHMMNARIYIRIFMAILFLGMMPSCTYDTIYVGGLNEHANVTLSLKLGDQPIVESRADGDDDPEDAISTVELFFYEADATSSDVAFHYVSNEEITRNGESLTFSMPAEVLEEYCAAGDKCKVYAIVNRDDETELPSTYNQTSLEQMVLNAAFINDAKEPQVPASFVMHGWDTEVTRTGNVLDGEIHVQRVAAKITLDFIEYKKDNDGNFILKSDGTYEVTPVTKFTVTENNIKYTADIADVKIALRRGISRSYLGSVYSGTDKKDYLFDTSYVDYKSETTGNDNVSTYTINNTFYTYPTNWAGDENSRTYLALEITWHSGNEEVETYYGINVNPAASNLASNNHYQILQAISVLGSTDEEEPVILDDPRSYQVVDWGTASSSGKLELAKYLVVDETNIVLQNVVTKIIYFSSSAPIDLTNVTVNWMYTAQDEAKNLPMATISNASREENSETYVIRNSADIDTGFKDNRNQSILVDNRIKDRNKTGDVRDENKNGIVKITIHNSTNEGDRSYIEFEHKLDNSMTATADYTAYTIEFSVAHQNNANYNETICITQYPMLSIEADQNTTFSTNNGGGYVYIDNTHSTTINNWREISGGLTNNKCPNRYFVSVSTLIEGFEEKYIIGDPRTTSRKLTGATQNLSNYLPADINVDPRMISPQFMTASSYGQCPVYMTKAQAELRCATYQEDGYPAGRWRLPTQAEVNYAIQLKEWEVIPELFTSGQNYWNANSDENTNGGRGVVRCVYDTWYWGTERVAIDGYQYLDQRVQ